MNRVVTFRYYETYTPGENIFWCEETWEDAIGQLNGQNVMFGDELVGRVCNVIPTIAYGLNLSYVDIHVLAFSDILLERVHCYFNAKVSIVEEKYIDAKTGSRAKVIKYINIINLHLDRRAEDWWIEV